MEKEINRGDLIVFTNPRTNSSYPCEVLNFVNEELIEVYILEKYTTIKGIDDIDWGKTYEYRENIQSIVKTIEENE